MNFHGALLLVILVNVGLVQKSMSAPSFLQRFLRGITGASENKARSPSDSNSSMPFLTATNPTSLSEDPEADEFIKNLSNFAANLSAGSNITKLPASNASNGMAPVMTGSGWSREVEGENLTTTTAPPPSAVMLNTSSTISTTSTSTTPGAQPSTLNPIISTLSRLNSSSYRVQLIIEQQWDDSFNDPSSIEYATTERALTEEVQKAYADYPDFINTHLVSFTKQDKIGITADFIVNFKDAGTHIDRLIQLITKNSAKAVNISKNYFRIYVTNPNGRTVKCPEECRPDDCHASCPASCCSQVGGDQSEASHNKTGSGPFTNIWTGLSTLFSNFFVKNQNASSNGSSQANTTPFTSQFVYSVAPMGHEGGNTGTTAAPRARSDIAGPSDFGYPFDYGNAYNAMFGQAGFPNPEAAGTQGDNSWMETAKYFDNQALQGKRSEIPEISSVEQSAFSVGRSAQVYGFGQNQFPGQYHNEPQAGPTFNGQYFVVRAPGEYQHQLLRRTYAAPKPKIRVWYPSVVPNAAEVVQLNQWRKE